jgi:Rieske Fe-S protein
VGATPSVAPDAYDIREDKSIEIHVNKVRELAHVGGSVKILDSNIDDSLIVVRTAEDSYVAASIKCTHRGVEVEYRADEKCFKCASLGGSRFKKNGEKMRGFAKGPLKTYPVSLEGDILLVRLQ